MVSATNGPPVLNGSAYIYFSRTLAELRDDLLCMLGFPDPLTDADAETRTLVQLREIIFRRLGHYYNAGANPPGSDEQIDSWINEAQQTVFRTVEFDKAGIAFPAIMVADVDPTELDYVPILALATGLAKAHHLQNDAKVYFDELTKYISDRALRRPPNIVAMVTKWLERAQKHCYFKYKLLRTERWWKIPLSQGNRIYDVPSISSGELTDVSFDLAARTITRLTGSWYTDGFIEGYRIKGYGATNAGNNDVQWTILSMTALVLTLAVGDVVVDEAAGATITINTSNYISLDFRTVTEAWLEDDGRWLTLFPGIEAKQFNITQETIPVRYELREFFEVFPIPNKAYNAWVKGHFGLLPFTADNDKTTIDPEAVLLQALVWGKMHFEHKDAMLQAKELDDFVKRLNAGTHAGKRYIPNPGFKPAALPYPKVTFPRV
jgi:hypothetical protein